jgi:hypothetical protein
MDTAHARVRVDDGSFLLAEDTITPETLDFSTGLIGTMTAGAMICAGIHTGYVTVRAATTDSPSAYGDTTTWEDIAEASVHAIRGSLRIRGLYDDPPEQLPLLSTHGPGWYRIRAHARGRDINRDGLDDASREEYLILCWPASPATPHIIRATDTAGLGLRKSMVKPLDPPPSVTPRTPQDQALRDSLLDAMKKPR